ncbi:MAG TPA: hypothetical protein VGP86_16575 [Xanthobacteraceae bacterium]|jgi:hypothetical protein|nr:hypothetical protein [Xanthobacteraceae bacterium]
MNLLVPDSLRRVERHPSDADCGWRHGETSWRRGNIFTSVYERPQTELGQRGVTD